MCVGGVCGVGDGGCNARNWTLAMTDSVLNPFAGEVDGDARHTGDGLGRGEECEIWGGKCDGSRASPSLLIAQLSGG